MIYEFAATQDLHGYTEPWAPGTSRNKLDLENRLEVRKVTQGASEPLDFTDPFLGIGVTRNGVWASANITTYSVEPEKISLITKSAGYGLGFSFDCDPETDYVLSVIDPRINVVGVGFYDADGLYMSNHYINAPSLWTFKTPADCAHMIISFTGYNNIESVFNHPMLELGTTPGDYVPYANVCMPEGFNIWDPSQDKMIQVYAGYVNANTRELYLRPVYEEYAGEELVGPWMSSWDPYEEDTTPTEGAFVIDFGGELTSYEITPFMLQTLLDSLGIRQHFTNGAGLLNSLMDQAQGRVRSEEELLHLSRPLNVIAIGDQLPSGITFKPISKDVLPGLPGKFIR